MKKFEQAKQLLESLDDYRNPVDFSDEMISAVTADFDRLFELTWKFMKEYMQHSMMIKAAVTRSPKDILKLAYKENLITNEDEWLDILKDRNDDAHLYNYGAAILYVSRINDRYIEIIRRCIADFSELIPEEELPNSRVKASFFEEWEKSGLSMDDFVENIRLEKGYSTKREVIDNWE